MPGKESVGGVFKELRVLKLRMELRIEVRITWRGIVGDFSVKRF
jgi:hypothetical protein